MLGALVEREGAGEVTLNADVTPWSVRRDAEVARRVPVVPHWGNLVHPPGAVTTAAGAAYRVFTPFWRRWRSLAVAPPPTAGSATVADDPGDGVPVTDPPAWPVGGEAAADRLEELSARVDGYARARDRLDVPGTSRMSVDLRFGAVAARTVVERIGDHTPGREEFIRQLAWRDFHAHVLAAHPGAVDSPLRRSMTELPWIDDAGGLRAWREGRTGYPVVDAAMRQLAVEGWVHNRARLVAASFLVKDLLVDWRRGERWFRRLLADGDVANNVGDWQWVAGTGTDAAPFFRIFNPVTQSRRFDPAGTWIRRWVPELAGLAAPAVHAPFEADPTELAAAGVRLGETYPFPIVDHAEARTRALTAFRSLTGRS